MVAEETITKPAEEIVLTDAATPLSETASLLSPHTTILPDCRAKQPKRQCWHFLFGWMVRVYCANCGADGPLVPEKNCNFAFYLCLPCYETHGAIAGTYIEPDVVFWEKVKQAQLEEFGRELTGPEIIEALKDENHILSKLARERST